MPAQHIDLPKERETVKGVAFLLRQAKRKATGIQQAEIRVTLVQALERQVDACENAATQMQALLDTLPEEQTVVTVVDGEPSHDEWVCLVCSAINHVSRPQCQQCLRPRGALR